MKAKIVAPAIKDQKIISAPAEFDHFINSSVYADFIAELDIRIRETTRALDDYELKMGGRQYDMLRGRKRNLEEMQKIFEEMKSNKEHDLELNRGD